MVHFTCPTISSAFHCSSHFVLKIDHFHYVSVENHRWKYGQEGFMWNPNIKAINVTKLVQMIFNSWFGYFEFGGYLPRGVTLSNRTSCRDLIPVNWSTRTWSIIQPEISSTKLHGPLFTCSITHSSFSANLCLCFSCIFIFLDILNMPKMGYAYYAKHNMPKMFLFSFVFNIKMATQKFTSLIHFLKMHTDMSAVTMQSNKIVSNEIKDS